MIIEKGNVVVMKDNKEIRRMGSGEAFGEQALYFNSVR